MSTLQWGFTKCTDTLSGDLKLFKKASNFKGLILFLGVKHFFYGKLPEMGRHRFTEPNLNEANYLRYKCGLSDNLTSIWENQTTLLLGDYSCKKCIFFLAVNQFYSSLSVCY